MNLGKTECIAQLQKVLHRIDLTRSNCWGPGSRERYLQAHRLIIDAICELQQIDITEPDESPR